VTADGNGSLPVERNTENKT